MSLDDKRDVQIVKAALRAASGATWAYNELREEQIYVEHDNCTGKSCEKA